MAFLKSKGEPAVPGAVLKPKEGGPGGAGGTLKRTEGKPASSGGRRGPWSGLLKRKEQAPNGQQAIGLLKEILDPAEIDGTLIKLRDGTFSSLVEVEGEMFSLLAEGEQDIRVAAYAQVLNGLPWPVEVTVFTQPVDLGPFEASLADKAPTMPLAAIWLNTVEVFTQSVLAERTVLSVNAKTSAEVRIRASQLLGALSRNGFRAVLADSTRLGEILLLSYGHPPGDVSRLLDGLPQTLKAMGGSLAENLPTLSDLLSPPAVIEEPGVLDLGGVFASTLMAVAYPSDVSNQWLDRLYRFRPQGIATRVSFHLEPVLTSKALTELNRKLVDLSVAERFANRQGKFANVETELGLEDAYALRQDLARGTQRMFEVTLLVTLLSADKEALRRAVAQVKQDAQGWQLPLRETYLEELSAFRSTVPLGRTLITRERPIPSLALSTTFPLTAGEILHPVGEFWGRNYLTGNAVIIDPRQIPAPHMGIIGSTGSGKSATYKTLLTQARLDPDTDVILIDPSAAIDYERLTAALEGSYIRFGPGLPHRINVCAIELPDDPRLMDDDENQRPVTNKVVFLTLLLGLMAYPEGDMPPDERALVEEPLYRMYEAFGMRDDWASIVDPGARSLRAQARKMPTLYDVLAFLGKVPELHTLTSRIRPFVTGTLSMFAGETNVDTSGPFVVLNVKGLVDQGGEEIQRVAYAIIMEHIRTRLLASHRRKFIGVDEAHLLFTRKDTAHFMATLYRTARKLGGRVTLLTQSITDLIGDPRTGTTVSGQNDARACLTQTGLTLLMRNDKDYDLDLLGVVYGLSEAEKRFLKMANQGEGILIAGDKRVLVQVLIPPELYPLITTRPEEVS